MPSSDRSPQFCVAKCRHMVITRGGTAYCLRWGRVKLDEHKEPDPYGEPLWWRREGCQGHVR